MIDNGDNEWKYRRHFTVEQANAMLPLVRAVAKDLAELARDVYDRHERLAHLKAARFHQPADMYGEELSQIESELGEDNGRMTELVRELNHLGVESKNPLEGLVDFPTLVDGREAYLCWKFGEPEVLFWHDLEAGFAGRQSLTAEAAVDSGAGSASERDGDIAGH